MDLLKYLQEHLNAPTIERLGSSLGLNPQQSQAVAAEILPAQLDVLTQQANTEAGAQRLLDLAQHHVPVGSVTALTATPADLSRLQQAGAAILPRLMGMSLDQDTPRIAASSGVAGGTVRQMMELLLPLLLGLIAGRATDRGLKPTTLATLFGGAALPGTAAATSTVISSTPEVIIDRGPPVSARVPAPHPPARPVVPPVQEEARRRGLGWLWLLPLLLLLLLGGCYLLQKRPAPLTLINSTEPVTSAAPITLSGTGRAGETITVRENSTQVATTQVAADGTYSASISKPAAGEHTYTVGESGTDATLSRTLTVAAPAVTAPVTPAVVPAPSPVANPITPPAVSTASASTTLAFTAPATGATVPAGNVTLRGTGPISTSIALTEDGNSLGQTTSDASGAWSFVVPSPAAGAHTYAAAANGKTSRLNLTVTAGTASTGACTKTFSLSLKDGQTVKQPFRFGGAGTGKSYVVTVNRGSRQIGRKVLPLDSACGWSYTSKPGRGHITYTLRENGKSAVARRITLNVLK